MKTQWQKILDHMKKHGSISSFEAEKEYGITRLTLRIMYLKGQGYNITEEIRTREDRWGKPYQYLAYVLRED